MQEPSVIISAYIAAINITGFLLIMLDKRKAVKSRRRIPEKTLLITAILGAGPGIYLGMKLFRHKTQKPLFYIGIPVIGFINTATLLLLFFNLNNKN